MISENNVDLTGFVYNIMLKDQENVDRIFFTLSVRNRFRDKGGQYTTRYDTVACTIFGNKDANGKHRKSFEYLNQNLVEGQFIRIQGRLSSWTEALVDGELVRLTEENKGRAKRIISRNNVIISDYALLESKEDTLKRLKGKQEETTKETEFETQTEPDNDSLYHPFYPDEEFPVYKQFGNFVS